jgi:formiminotetrahydrofolate cyclodeaminase
MSEYIKRKKDMRFQSVEALQTVVSVVNESDEALKDKKRTITESAIPELLGVAFTGGIVAVAGVFVLAALAAGGLGMVAHLKYKKYKQLEQEKERLFQEVLKKHNEILEALKKESDSNNERINYLNSLNILLQQAINDLKHDLEYVT